MHGFPSYPFSLLHAGGTAGPAQPGSGRLGLGGGSGSGAFASLGVGAGAVGAAGAVGGARRYPTPQEREHRGESPFLVFRALGRDVFVMPGFLGGLCGGAPGAGAAAGGGSGGGNGGGGRGYGADIAVQLCQAQVRRGNGAAVEAKAAAPSDTSRDAATDADAEPDGADDAETAAVTAGGEGKGKARARQRRRRQRARHAPGDVASPNTPVDSAESKGQGGARAAVGTAGARTRRPVTPRPLPPQQLGFADEAPWPWPDLAARYARADPPSCPASSSLSLPAARAGAVPTSAAGQGASGSASSSVSTSAQLWQMRTKDFLAPFFLPSPAPSVFPPPEARAAPAASSAAFSSPASSSHPATPAAATCALSPRSTAAALQALVLQAQPTAASPSQAGHSPAVAHARPARPGASPQQHQQHQHPSQQHTQQQDQQRLQQLLATAGALPSPNPFPLASAGVGVSVREPTVLMALSALVREREYWQYACPPAERGWEHAFFMYGYKVVRCAGWPQHCLCDGLDYHRVEERRRGPLIEHHALACPDVKGAHSSHWGSPTAACRGSTAHRLSHNRHAHQHTSHPSIAAAASGAGPTLSSAGHLTTTSTATSLGPAPAPAASPAPAWDCGFAHTLLELMYHPAVFKTTLCAHFDERDPASWRCVWKRRCAHAHGIADLRSRERAKAEWEAHQRLCAIAREVAGHAPLAAHPHPPPPPPPHHQSPFHPHYKR